MPDLRELLDDASTRAQYTSPQIQKDILNAAATLNRRSSLLEVALFIKTLVMGINIASGSPKRKDQFNEAAKEAREKAIENGLVKTGRGLNQATDLARPGDTR